MVGGFVYPLALHLILLLARRICLCCSLCYVLLSVCRVEEVISNTAMENSVYVGNLDQSVPLAKMEDVIYELFLQVNTAFGTHNEVAHFMSLL